MFIEHVPKITSLDKPILSVGLTVNQTVERGPLGRTSIWEAIRSGALPARRFGRKVIILEEDWQAFLHSLPRVKPREAA